MKNKRFQRIYIEIINRCNLRCSFCPIDNRAPRMLSADEFMHIASEAAKLTDYICLHVKGEPLMHPQIAEILSIASRYHLKINLTTNATLIPEKGHLLLGTDAPRQVALSLHSFDANTMHTTDFKTYLSESVAFAKTFTAKTPGFISFRLWNLDAAAKKDQRIRNQLILETLEQAYELDTPIASRAGRANGNTLAERTFLNFDYLFDWPDLLAPDYGERGTCYGLRRQLAVLADGSVVPCCLDNGGILTLGNIFSESLEMILQKEKSLRIIEGFQNRHISEELCRHCGYRTRF